MVKFSLMNKTYESAISKFNYFLSYRTTDDILELFNEIAYLIDSNMRKSKALIGPKIYDYYPSCNDVSFYSALADVVHSDSVLPLELSRINDSYYNLRFYLGLVLK